MSKGIGCPLTAYEMIRKEDLWETTKQQGEIIQKQREQLKVAIALINKTVTFVRYAEYLSGKDYCQEFANEFSAFLGACPELQNKYLESKGQL